MTLETLKKSETFVCWKYTDDGNGRMTKVPIAPLDNAPVGTTAKHSKRWGHYTTTKIAAEVAKHDGIGFVFTKITDTLSICGIDIDHQDPGNEFVKKIIAIDCLLKALSAGRDMPYFYSTSFH